MAKEGGLDECDQKILNLMKENSNITVHELTKSYSMEYQRQHFI